MKTLLWLGIVVGLVGLGYGLCTFLLDARVQSLTNKLSVVQRENDELEARLSVLDGSAFRSKTTIITARENNGIEYGAVWGGVVITVKPLTKKEFSECKVLTVVHSISDTLYLATVKSKFKTRF